jgi:hypothetical protein
MEFSREANLRGQSSGTEGPPWLRVLDADWRAAVCCGGGMCEGVLLVLAQDAGEDVELQDCWPAEAAWSVPDAVLLPVEGPAAYSRWRIMHQT